MAYPYDYDEYDSDDLRDFYGLFDEEYRALNESDSDDLNDLDFGDFDDLDSDDSVE